jgi:phage anti-repressor protein
MDYNKDGLISPDDLMNLLGAKKESSSFFNELIVHDVLKVVEYIDLMKKRSVIVRDTANNSILRDDKLTLMKYRISKMKEKKRK